MMFVGRGEIMESVLQILISVLFIGGIISFFVLPKKQKGYSIYLLVLGFSFYNVGRGNLVFYILPITSMIIAVVCSYITTKELFNWLYIIAPAIVGAYLWYSYQNYSGVINPRWLVLISTFTLIISMLLTVRLRKVVWKIVIYFSMIAVILVTIVLYPTPTYTYSEGRNILSTELGKTVSQTANGRRRALPILVDNIFLDCIDYVYIFEVIDNGNITIYAVHPLSGAWDEVYYPSFGD